MNDPRRISRRDALLAAAGACIAGGSPGVARAFGEEGAFNPRMLLVGEGKWEGVRTTAPAHWADEVDRRTSAPARLRPTLVRADADELFAEPFVIWGGAQKGTSLLAAEIAGLRQFFTMGGVLVVDDFDPDTGAFATFAKKELARVLPEQTPIAVGTENVVFRSFYLLKRAFGRVSGPEKLEGIFRGGVLQVIISNHDILGALARDSTGGASLEVTPGGEEQREQATRLAVNIALYVLCSNYKDDQVHAEQIMKRRGRSR
jgi:hypothetical protein